MKKRRSPKTLFLNAVEESAFNQLDNDPDAVLTLLRRSRALIDTMNDHTHTNYSSFLPSDESELVSLARARASKTHVPPPDGAKLEEGGDFADTLRKAIHTLVTE